MGCTAGRDSACFDDEKPARKVTVGDFYLGKYEVTQGLWTAVMGSFPSGKRGGSKWSNSVSSKHGVGDNHPVYFVSWNDAQKFIRKLNKMTGKKYRLPTEAEWEFAARGGNLSNGYIYSGGEDFNEVAWNGNNSGYYMFGKTQPVGTKRPNELGIYDMSGNVGEWVNDRYGVYPSSEQIDPKGPSTGTERVRRGGSCWADGWRSRVSFRRPESSRYRECSTGFRLAHDP